MQKFACVLFLFCLFACARTYASRRKGELNDESNNAVPSWQGKWFPHQPTVAAKESCDDGMHGIEIDFAPADQRQNYNYLCISSNYTSYVPNLQTQPVLMEYYVPRAYQAQTKCLNETIAYDELVPAYGPHRPLPVKLGTYMYLPPQRWMQGLAQGAIVLLYHPCSDLGQRSLLEKMVRACLYHHIISASAALTAERPFALLAWGKRLQMSVVDERIALDFIKQNAKQGPLYQAHAEPPTHYYEAGLLDDAHLVTDLADSEVCGYKSEGM